jgi:hypothetical protein
MRQESSRSVSICLKFHHEDVWRGKTETLFSISIISMQLVKEMTLAQPILYKGRRIISYGPTRASMGISTYLLASVDSVASGRETNRIHSTEVLTGW